MPFWVFIVAALIMAGVAFTVIFAAMRPASKPIDLPSVPETNSTNGSFVLPTVPQPALSGEYYTGNNSSSVLFVEYSDFQCPFCGRAIPALDRLMSDYPQIKFVFRNFPLDAHPNAEKAAEAAECAGRQGKFWEMHDVMFSNQDQLSITDLKRFASGLGLDSAAFASCLDRGEAAGVVKAEKQEGQAAGIRGTPGFLVYTNRGRDSGIEKKLMAISDRFRSLGVSSAVVNVQGAGSGLVFAGAMPYSDYQSVIDAFN